MSGSASRASIFEVMNIKNDKKQANLTARTFEFSYYESVYSPEITAFLRYIDSSGALKADKEQDIQEREGSIKSSLPIVGEEDLEFKILTKSGTLDFTKKPFRVNGSATVAMESQRQAVDLTLVSQPAIENEEIKNPTITYKGRISDNVKKILSELNISFKSKNIDPTRNSYDFISRSKGGLDLILDLCRRSIPTNGDPGYFFYETQDGHKFKAIDNLISQPPVETYTYTGALSSNADNDENDFKIVKAPVFLKDQNIKDRKKWVASRNIFFNPYKLKVDEQFYVLKTAEGEVGDEVKKTLGKKITSTRGTKGYSTTNYHILDIGSLDYQNLTPNNDPREWQAKSPMRYNLLHTQMMEIQVPCNVRLSAGDVIKVKMERQGDEKELGGFDEHVSGNYLILHLCHNFDNEKSFTSMTLARDTYGLIVKEEGNSNEQQKDESGLIFN